MTLMEVVKALQKPATGFILFSIAAYFSTQSLLSWQKEYIVSSVSSQTDSERSSPFPSISVCTMTDEKWRVLSNLFNQDRVAAQVNQKTANQSNFLAEEFIESIFKDWEEFPSLPPPDNQIHFEDAQTDIALKEDELEAFRTIFRHHMTSANVLNNKESCGGMVYKLLEFHDSENINLKKASIFHELARLISEKTFGFHMVHPLFMYLNGYDLPPPMDFPMTPPFPPEMRVGEFPMIAADWETVDECLKVLRELEKSLTLPEEQVEVPRFDGKQLLQTYLLENQEDYMASEILFNELYANLGKFYEILAKEQVKVPVEAIVQFFDNSSVPLPLLWDLVNDQNPEWIMELDDIAQWYYDKTTYECLSNQDGTYLKSSCYGHLEKNLAMLNEGLKLKNKLIPFCNTGTSLSLTECDIFSPHPFMQAFSLGCETFDSDKWISTRKTNLDSITFAVDSYTFQRPKELFQPFKIFLHETDALKYNSSLGFLQGDSILVQPGYKVDISVEFDQINATHRYMENTNCVQLDNNTNANYPGTSQDDVLKEAMDLCNCRPWYSSSTSPDKSLNVCNRNGTVCLSTAIATLLETKRNMYQRCSSWEYSIVMNEKTIMDSETGVDDFFYQKYLTTVTIHLDNSPSSMVLRDIGMSFESIVANLGAIFGITLGLSILQVFTWTTNGLFDLWIYATAYRAYFKSSASGPRSDKKKQWVKDSTSSNSLFGCATITKHLMRYLLILAFLGIALYLVVTEVAQWQISPVFSLMSVRSANKFPSLTVCSPDDGKWKRVKKLASYMDNSSNVASKLIAAASSSEILEQLAQRLWIASLFWMEYNPGFLKGKEKCWDIVEPFDFNSAERSQISRILAECSTQKGISGDCKNLNLLMAITAKVLKTQSLYKNNSFDLILEKALDHQYDLIGSFESISIENYNNSHLEQVKQTLICDSLDLTDGDYQETLSHKLAVMLKAFVMIREDLHNGDIIAYLTEAYLTKPDEYIIENFENEQWLRQLEAIPLYFANLGFNEKDTLPIPILLDVLDGKRNVVNDSSDAWNNFPSNQTVNLYKCWTTNNSADTCNQFDKSVSDVTSNDVIMNRISMIGNDSMIVPLCKPRGEQVHQLTDCASLFKPVEIRPHNGKICHTFDGANLNGNRMLFLVDDIHLLRKEDLQAPFSLFLHEQGSEPPLDLDVKPSSLIQRGKKSHITVTDTEVGVTNVFQSLSFSQRNCLLKPEVEDRGKLWLLDRSYNQFGCIISRMIAAGTEKCHCQPWHLNLSMPVCGLQGSQCYIEETERILRDSRKLEKDCPLTCQSNSYRAHLVSAEDLKPEQKLQNYIRQQYNDKAETFGFLSSNMVHTNLYNLKNYIDWRLTKMAVVKIELSNAPSPLFTSDTRITLMNLVGLIGGTFGIFIGFSFFNTVFIMLSIGEKLAAFWKAVQGVKQKNQDLVVQAEVDNEAESDSHKQTSESEDKDSNVISDEKNL